MRLRIDTIFKEKDILFNKYIELENGIVKDISDYSNQKVDSHYWGLCTGLFDSHINGGEKWHFTQKPDVDTLHDIYQSSLKTGVSFVLPTLITSPIETILQGINAIKEHKKLYPDSGILGIHLEGPFINKTKRGAHLEKHILSPTIDVIKSIIDKAEGHIKLWTIAPENFDDDTLNVLIESGITLSVGHSNASFTESNNAFSKGIKLVTHLYNAMSAFSHRSPGLIGATLNNDSVYAPIILDGIHCDFEAAKLAYKCKKDSLFLISDALFLNNKVKQFEWEEFDAFLKNDAYFNSEGNLAGGALSLPQMIANAVQHCDIPLNEALDMASNRVFKALNLNDKCPKLEIGSKADFCVFSKDLKIFKTLQSMAF